MLQSFKISLSGAGVMSKMNLCNYIQNIIKIFLSPTTYLYVPGFFPIFQVQQTDYRRQIDIIAIINSEVRILDMSTCVFPPHFSFGVKKGVTCCRDLRTAALMIQEIFSMPFQLHWLATTHSMRTRCNYTVLWSFIEIRSKTKAQAMEEAYSMGQRARCSDGFWVPGSLPFCLHSVGPTWSYHVYWCFYQFYSSQLMLIVLIRLHICEERGKVSEPRKINPTQKLCF